MYFQRTEQNSPTQTSIAKQALGSGVLYLKNSEKFHYYTISAQQQQLLFLS
jgi:hypothetical protein